MAYQGQVPQSGNFVKLDDISGQFNNSTSVFNTTISGQSYTVSNAYATHVFANGLALNPGIDYYFNGSTIVFAVSPSSSLVGKFFIMVYGDVLNTGVPSNNSITNAMVVPGTLQYGTLAATPNATILANSLIFGA